MADTKPRSSLLQFVVVFLLVYTLTQFAFRTLFPERYGNQQQKTGVELTLLDDSVKGGHHPTLTIANHTAAPLALAQRCPQPPVDVFAVERPGKAGEKMVPLEAADTVLPCTYPAEIGVGESIKLELSPWKYSLFGDYGTYEVQLAYDPESDATATARFEIYEAGVVTQVFRTFVTKPLLNLLILIASLTPGYNLGVSIIILTLAVKFLLFVPTQHALEGQKRLQAVQPKIDKLREKHKNDPQKMNQEMLELWKREKINPLQSCLPMLLQFPVLIGLFFVIRDGSTLELSQHLLYGSYQELPWTFGTQFLGFDLLVPSIYVMPPLLVAMQFFQLKLSFAIAKKKQEKKDDGKKNKKQKAEEPSMQQTQQKVMQYVLPLMIGVFAFQFPAAVSLYWAVSTVFAIGQQVVVNRKEIG